MTDVQVTDVIKRFGDFVALDKISLEIPDRCFFALLGPSGSGKTTLLRLLAGFLEPDSGAIRLDGMDVSQIPAWRRNIGMVFQNYALFPHMTVHENVAFGLRVRGRPRVETHAMVRKMLDLVQLTGLDERKPRQLSGGQQQRVALARALVTEPRLLLLDEPLGALDKRLRQEMQIELKRIQRTVGITTIFVTHDQEEALTLSDRIAIIDNGLVIQVGSPSDVYERPATQFAADFLGDANFMTGIVVENGIQIDGAGYIVAATRPSGERAMLAVRPEKMQLERPGHQRGGRNAIEGVVVQSVFSGTSVTYIVDTVIGRIRVFRQNSDSDIMSNGEDVLVVWQPEHSVLVKN